jgi:hypothetical protein
MPCRAISMIRLAMISCAARRYLGDANVLPDFSTLRHASSYAATKVSMNSGSKEEFSNSGIMDTRVLPALQAGARCVCVSPALPLFLPYRSTMRHNMRPNPRHGQLYSHSLPEPILQTRRTHPQAATSDAQFCRGAVSSWSQLATNKFDMFERSSTAAAVLPKNSVSPGRLLTPSTIRS